MAFPLASVMYSINLNAVSHLCHFIFVCSFLYSIKIAEAPLKILSFFRDYYIGQRLALLKLLQLFWLKINHYIIKAECTYSTFMLINDFYSTLEDFLLVEYTAFKIWYYVAC